MTNEIEWILDPEPEQPPPPTLAPRAGRVLQQARRVQYNSPVTLTFTFLALAVLGLSLLTGGASNAYFSAYRGSFSNPLTYVRMFTHILGHANWSHFFGNFMIVLLIGPMLEEKYGSKRLALMILVTAFVTGILHVLFSSTAILGASGVVFMMILLASFANMQAGRIPLTLILVLVLYLGQEVVNWVVTDTNIAHSAHIIGGLCGAVFGFLANGKQGRSDNPPELLAGPR